MLAFCCCRKCYPPCWKYCWWINWNIPNKLLIFQPIVRQPMLLLLLPQLSKASVATPERCLPAGDARWLVHNVVDLSIYQCRLSNRGTWLYISIFCFLSCQKEQMCETWNSAQNNGNVANGIICQRNFHCKTCFIGGWVSCTSEW